MANTTDAEKAEIKRNRESSERNKAAGAPWGLKVNKSKAKHRALVKLGKKAMNNFGYRIEDHKGNVLKKGGKDF